MVNNRSLGRKNILLRKGKNEECNFKKTMKQDDDKLKGILLGEARPLRARYKVNTKVCRSAVLNYYN